MLRSPLVGALSLCGRGEGGGKQGDGGKEAAMRHATLIVTILLWCAASAWAEMGFDPKYERDYNIFNPMNRYAPDNPLNPANAYALDNPFNPVNRFDPGNPANPLNQYNPNNPFNPANRFHPENPLNPANQLNPAVPFSPLDGGAGRRSTR